MLKSQFNQYFILNLHDMWRCPIPKVRLGNASKTKPEFFGILDPWPHDIYKMKFIFFLFVSAFLFLKREQVI